MTMTEPETITVDTHDDPPSASHTTTPLILDLGNRKRKAIRALRKGRGPAMAEVRDVLEEVQAELGDDAAGKVLLPVIVLYGKKRRKRNGSWF